MVIRPHRPRVLAFFVLVAAGLFFSRNLAGQTIHVRYEGDRLLGKPVFWNDSEVYLMERDGKISWFRPNQAKDYKVVAKDFRLYSQSQLRGRLQSEFGSRYDVSGTGQYLVVHPAGQRDLWADRFEQLYRSMLHYYKVRRIRVRRPALPFVAVVFYKQSEYLRYARKVDADFSGTLGVYLESTNRIYLYDRAGGKQQSDWQINEQTIVHEASHQTAFNIGIHRRYGANPFWVCEGIGSLFEARGVSDSHRYRDLPDRINVLRLGHFKQGVPKKELLETVKNLIVSDRAFSRSPNKAYGAAWAMTFYLAERRPGAYASYLSRLYRRRAFASYSAGERIQDFQRSFGDIPKFASSMRNYFESISSNGE